ncbi:MAG: RimK family alpha-L-glutamate ligase [Planctomycetales bacterium]|nr:RimK family alpha-L-glutamate ligase [Planctomycetales bacterium]
MNALPAAPMRFLMLGPQQGWHAEQLRNAARRQGHRLDVASYESISAQVGNPAMPVTLSGESGTLSQYDAILTRTMPGASMEKITFRLAALHAIADNLLGKSIVIINPPRALELSIDKFATLARLAAAGYPTPPTRIVQSRGEAMRAFEELGSDCIVKPIFGGEGRGVMRICDPQLAWYAFSTLDQMDAVLQIQAFIKPGGKDTRLLVVGNQVYGVRRYNPNSFRSNVAAGATCQKIDVDDATAAMAKRIAAMFGLVFASVDLIDNDHGPQMYLEVNAIPGWKGAQAVIDESIADAVLTALIDQSRSAVA